MKHSLRWDLTTIPDDLIISEYKRRIGLKGGRPRKDDPATEERRRKNRERIARWRLADRD